MMVPTMARRHKSMKRGFTLLEMLVVMLIIGILVGGALTALQHQLPHLRLRQAATELSSFFQRARLKAIQSGRNVRIEPEVTLSPPSERLVMREQMPDGTWREIASWTTPKPASRPDVGVFLKSHEPAAVVGNADAFSFKAPGGVAEFRLTFTPTGSNRETGSARLTCLSNTLEVALTSYGGSPVIRKYLQEGDRPASADSTEYFREGGFGSDIKWKWY